MLNRIIDSSLLQAQVKNAIKIVIIVKKIFFIIIIVEVV